MEQRPFAVVFVCTGNRFRSALAEAIFREVTAGADVSVESYGTLDIGRVPALGEAGEEARRLGVDISAHYSRPLAGVDLSGADLVVGFERTHMATAVVDAHAARDRTFLLPELVELIESGEAVADPRRAIASAALRRESRTTTEELADPLGRSADAQRAIADQVDELTRRLAAALFGRRRAGTSATRP